ncbi:hypothetical protein Hdeb2414_s0022g00615701 [Helianthus debilis subsp. tardiflorus]
MTKDRWLQSALTNEVLVADLLLRLKHSSDSYSLRTPANKPLTVAAILPPRWGNRKTRSKSAAVANGFVKDKEHRRSPTTHLSWSGGAGSSSDGYEDCSRPSDLSSASRSLKHHGFVQKRFSVANFSYIFDFMSICYRKIISE